MRVALLATGRSGGRVLSDAEWADVAAEVMDRTGLAARGDDGGCRWGAAARGTDEAHAGCSYVGDPASCLPPEVPQSENM